MHPRRWNIKRLSLIAIASLVLYIVCSCGYHKYNIDVVVKNTRPEEVWEYVADFSKMRNLNPSILDFKVISDQGNPHDWRYTVVYTERLTHWPHWLNTATGHYIVSKSMPGVEPVSHTIASYHQTCFFMGLYCLKSESEMQFSAVGKDTYCLERVRYQCPPFLSSACRGELEFQRKAVMHNLTVIFQRRHR